MDMVYNAKVLALLLVKCLISTTGKPICIGNDRTTLIALIQIGISFTTYCVTLHIKDLIHSYNIEQYASVRAEENNHLFFP